MKKPSRRTFAIISHPDAGKTTITEKLLLYGGAIQLAGTVKGRKAARHATSDWMEMEKERGISVTTSVMQFPYKDCIFNLLDTPGHEDFSEDTYRTLTAVDAALMVIDAVKGVEPRTIKLMQVCRLRNTPIITFINKLDRESRDPIELLDEIENILNIECAPLTWPIGSGRSFKGIYNFNENNIKLFKSGKGAEIQKGDIVTDIDNFDENLNDELELIKGASHEFEQEKYTEGKQTPVFFGSALSNFGIQELLDAFVDYAPEPQSRNTKTREVKPTEDKCTGFVFKIQANMDPQHRDRIAFMRVCSGTFKKGMKLKHLRINKDVQISNPLTFMAGERETVENAYAGDIVGIHNHGTIQIGDTFTQGEDLKFVGIPHFAPELFREVRSKDPLKAKALQKGLIQLSEEGATQVFRPLINNRIILGAIGILQFDIVAYRLKHEYKVDCVYEPVELATVRWIECNDSKMLENFKNRQEDQLGIDGSGDLVFMARSRINLSMMEEKWPEIKFVETKEH